MWDAYNEEFRSTFLQGGCAFFAFQRFKAGSDAAFSQGLGDEDAMQPDGSYQAYPGGAEDGGQYSEPPFSAGGAQQAGMAGDSAAFVGQQTQPRF